MRIEIVDENQLHYTSPCLLAKAFMVLVWYDAEATPELKKSPDEFQELIQDIETCGLCAEQSYETTPR